MPLVVSPHPAAPEPLEIDLAGLLPERVASLSLPEIARLVVVADGCSRDLGECFDLSGDPADAVIECRGDFSRSRRIAAGMSAGTLRVLGHAGPHAGEAMRGGRLEIAGDAGDWLGCELTGGEIHVAGDAGDNVAGALPGSVVGMRGGMVIVAGSAGHLAGSRLRRGIVAIGRDCGAAAGFEMRAGTVVIGGRMGAQPGLAMRRGSVISLTERPRPPATFRRGAAWQPPFVPLMLRRLAAAGFAPAQGDRPATWRQWHGDGLGIGRGELLHPA